MGTDGGDLGTPLALILTTDAALRGARLRDPKPLMILYNSDRAGGEVWRSCAGDFRKLRGKVQWCAWFITLELHPKSQVPEETYWVNDLSRHTVSGAASAWLCLSSSEAGVGVANMCVWGGKEGGGFAL